ncbi:hypothetical protein BH09VER1_BH09VER1_46170 [soil metagenome]
MRSTTTLSHGPASPDVSYSLRTPWKTLLLILRDLFFVAAGMVVTFIACLCVFALLWWPKPLPNAHPSHLSARADTLSARAAGN